jgi:Beta-propeller repeat.
MDIEGRLHSALYRSHMTMNQLLRLQLLLTCLCGFLAASSASAQNTQQLAFAGLRASNGKGQFYVVKVNASGNLYLLYDQKDGVRIIKTDATANQILAHTLIGAAGDSGLAMALDPAGNVYVTGTTTSGSLVATSGAAFSTRADSSTNSFVAKFDSSLNTIFVTYAGSGHMTAGSIAATADRVFITGSIFASTLPVTSSGIIQSPAAGSFGNGFVESFNANGTALIYSTYLSGLNGDTTPAHIEADANDNAYVAGYTTSTGYPTLAALVPNMLGTGSGFLTKLTSAGDGLLFSTFIPGSGITALALDQETPSLLISGTIAPGQFPISTVTSPLVSTDYQTVVRISLDGSRVLSSTLLAPGAESTITPAPNGTAWAAVKLSTPLLPLPTLSPIGSTAAFHITAQGDIDQNIRIGGKTLAGLPSLPTTIPSIAVNASGQPIFAGYVSPTTGSSQVTTQSYDLPLRNSLTPALPSTMRDAVLASCNGSLCAGSGAFLAKFNLTTGPSLALSTDTSPNLTLRNLGSSAATNVQLSVTGFTLSHNCSTQLGAGEECSIVLTGTGPGTLTVQSSNDASQTVSLPSVTRPAFPIPLSPSELDFGVITPLSPQARTVTAINLGSVAIPAPFTPTGPPSSGPLSVTSDCPPSPSQYLAPGVSCHAFFNASVPAATTSGTPFEASMGTVSGTSALSITAFLEPSDLNISSTEVDFGTQYPGGIRLPRFLYLSNNSATPIPHSTVALPPSSPFTVTDRCPSVLEPHSVCQLQIDYESPQASADSVTLSLDQGTSVLVTGQSIPQPGIGGSTVNPNLVVTPSSLDFPNAVVVTTASASSQTATISNTGAQPFPLALSLTGDFTNSTNCPNVLAGGASCAVVLTFVPSQAGARQGLLSVSSGAGITPAYVNLSGTGTPILASNNGTLDLGGTAIGQPVVQWYKVTQPFSQFTASTDGDFGVVLVEDAGHGHGQPAASAFTSNSTGSCFNCWVGVQFLPAIAGSQSASLKLASTASGNPYTLALSGNGLPLNGLLLAPAQQDFGPVPLHSSSAPTLFTLTNLTPTTANLSAPTVSGDFVISNAPTGGPTCGGPLAPNASCYLQIAYIPTAVGPAAGALTIASSTATATEALSGFGSPDPGLSINPTALTFRNVPGSTATQQTITLANTGLYNLQIAVPTSSSVSFQSSTTCSALVPGATCTITITFTPTNATVGGTLSIPVTSSTPGNPQTTYTVSLNGAYTSEDAGLQILPSQADYGPTPTSTVGLTRQFLINNLTAKSLNLSLSLPRQFVITEPPCVTLAPGAGCNFSVAFIPLTNGDITGTVFAQATPTDGSPALNGLVYLEGFGTGSGSITVTGDHLIPGRILDFGQVASGQTSIRTLSITNSGSKPVTLRRVTSEWPFLSTTTCGATLTPAGTCTVTLVYSPINQAATGSSSAPFNTDAGALVLESDAVSSPDFIDLTGTVTPITVAVPSNTAPLVSYTLSQGSLTFTATSGGDASAPQTVTLTNIGTTTIHVSNLSTTPDFAASGSCTSIVTGASCPITVTFTPQASSSQTTSTVISALEITSDSSTSLDFISLFGTATPPTLVLSPVALDFGQVLVGSSATLPLKVTNGSPTAAIFSSITVSGDYALTGDCPAAGAQFASSASCILQVTFKPAQTGVRTGAISIATSLTSLPLVANLTGTGAQSHLQTAPSSLAFANIAVGASASLTLSLANTGTAPVNQLSLSVTGEYAITRPCSVTSLSPGASCSVTITFTPSAAGARTGSLVIQSSDPSSPLTIPLTGAGTPSAAVSLTVNGGSSSSTTVKSGSPANYNLAVTALNGYSGTVVLNCTPINPGRYATCSLLPSSITLTTSTAQSSAATINTVSSVASASRTHIPNASTAAFCLFPLGLLCFRRTRGVVAVAIFTTATLFLAGCGSGGNLSINNGDPNLRYTPPGTYQYQVTASSTSGVQLSQTVTLNLTVTAQ